MVYWVMSMKVYRTKCLDIGDIWVIGGDRVWVMTVIMIVVPV